MNVITGMDFILHSTQLIFAPKETVKPCTFTILDDTEQPKLEVNEIFMISLHMAIGASLSPPHQALVTIDDTADDSNILLHTMPISCVKIAILQFLECHLLRLRTR